MRHACRVSTQMRTPAAPNSMALQLAAKGWNSSSSTRGGAGPAGESASGGGRVNGPASAADGIALDVAEVSVAVATAAEEEEVGREDGGEAFVSSTSSISHAAARTLAGAAERPRTSSGRAGDAGRSGSAQEGAFWGGWPESCWAGRGGSAGGACCSSGLGAMASVGAEGCGGGGGGVSAAGAAAGGGLGGAELWKGSDPGAPLPRRGPKPGALPVGGGAGATSPRGLRGSGCSVGLSGAARGDAEEGDGDIRCWTNASSRDRRLPSCELRKPRASLTSFLFVTESCVRRRKCQEGQGGVEIELEMKRVK